MEEAAKSFIERQYKRVGMLEALTPEVMEQMTAGKDLITHPYAKSYDDGNKAEVMIYAKRSADTEYYHLNKFQVQVQLVGKEERPIQTFYVNWKKVVNQDGQSMAKDEKYTLKQAYNLLCGRPVFNTFINKEGQEYQAWAQINFRNKLQNGNFEIKQYGEKYGFNLDNVLKNYSLKVLGNEDYTKSLKEELYRGNLQKTTFVHKDGVQADYYVSPSIKAGSLHIYDLDKKAVPLDDQAKRGLISEGFYQHLKQLFSQQQKQEASIQTEQPDTAPKKQTQDNKQSNTKEKKHNRKHKAA